MWEYREANQARIKGPQEFQKDGLESERSFQVLVPEREADIKGDQPKICLGEEATSKGVEVFIDRWSIWQREEVIPRETKEWWKNEDSGSIEEYEGFSEEDCEGYGKSAPSK